MQLNATLQGPMDGIVDEETEEPILYVMEREESLYLNQFEQQFFKHLGIGSER